jgi:hypothetical protein
MECAMPDFVQAIDGEIAALERELEVLPVYVKLRELKRVRSLYVHSDVAAREHGRSNRTEPKTVHAPHKKNAPPMSGKSLEAIKAVIGILDLFGTPMRTAQLIDQLASMGITFSGSAPQNTLSSLLSRSLEVESRGGHIGWALTKWNTAGDGAPRSNASPADDETPAQGREAGPGGGT